ncbi:hypothetical protein OG394_22930 [Kribbella sp. NBC_01245]|uniref:hypothetical protein n=1 Tax=Kribbella sp. NBC_01245 TaxID=2903578 RepID=UPI002E2AFF0A|nr:hypothetical protein [Kribbella sp. NBC_01245]
MTDELSNRLAALTHHLETEFGQAVLIERPDNGGVRIGDAAEAGIPITWNDHGPGTPLLHVDIGRHRVPLQRTAASIDYLEQIARAAITGQITESRAPGRTTLTITLPDGTTTTEHTYRLSFTRTPTHTHPPYTPAP